MKFTHFVKSVIVRQKSQKCHREGADNRCAHRPSIKTSATLRPPPGWSRKSVSGCWTGQPYRMGTSEGRRSHLSDFCLIILCTFKIYLAAKGQKVLRCRDPVFASHPSPALLFYPELNINRFLYFRLDLSNGAHNDKVDKGHGHPPDVRGGDFCKTE